MPQPHHLLSSHLPGVGVGVARTPPLSLQAIGSYEVASFVQILSAGIMAEGGVEKSHRSQPSRHTLQRQNPPEAYRQFPKGTPEASQVTHPWGPQALVHHAFLFAPERVHCSVMSNSWQPYGLQSTRLLCPWDSPSKNTGVGCHSLLQEIFLNQESNLGLPHCRQILYHLSHQGSPVCS